MIIFILYKPAVPGNIGASARAIKTMGFSEFRLINPVDHLSDEAKMFAHGSRDILEKCTVYNTYEEAVEDIDFVVCTTAKKKSAKVDYIPSDKLAAFLTQKQSLVKNIGVVFGSEESGLPNSILRSANAGVTIPMAIDYPSLNLSQAVMVIAYELAKKDNSLSIEDSEEQEKETWQQLQQRTESILLEAGIKPATPLFHRIIERMSFMKAPDARLAHSISSKIADLVKKRNTE
jgi:tRNA/rRNA methyltransferase